MRRALYSVAAIIAISSVALLFASAVQAADLTGTKRQFSRSDCGPHGCQWQRRHSQMPGPLFLLPAIRRVRPLWWSSLLGCVFLRLLHRGVVVKFFAELIARHSTS